MYLVLKIFLLLLLIGQTSFAQNSNNLQKGTVKSSKDGELQIFYYYKTTHTDKQPLIVQLHSWSFPADSLKTAGLDLAAIKKDYNYIFPDFRGINNQPKACCSEYAISDIDEAIDWALKNMPVDRKQIYIIGTSGGGYATLAMYMKSRHNIKGFSAWASITDLYTWYEQGVERKNKYPQEIIKCTGSNDTLDILKAKERSPLYWLTPVKHRKNVSLQIYAGIHDGYTGTVPISHSVLFYNKLLKDYKVKDSIYYVALNDLNKMLSAQNFSANKQFNKIDNREVYFQKIYKNIQLTIFEGGTKY